MDLGRFHIKIINFLCIVDVVNLLYLPILMRNYLLTYLLMLTEVF